jgi:hypothetical protein
MDDLPIWADDEAPPAAVEPGERKPSTLVTTPSGIEIAYFVEPKRKYEVRKPRKLPGLEYDWIEVPSVTTVLEVLDKPALPWWGMKTGVEGLRTLVEMQAITVGFDGDRYGFVAVGGDGQFLAPYLNSDGEQKDALVDLLNTSRLTVNHVKNKAADRGNGVHNALEAWAAVGAMPNEADFTYEEKGYIRGLIQFLIVAEAAGLKAEMMEVTVASVVHGFAGRFDLLARNEQDMQVITKIFPKRPPKMTTVPAGQRLLIDLKTSKEIYPTHLLQLEAYEGGLQECGYGPTDARAVLHVTSDGRYEFRQAKATLEDYVAMVHADQALKRVKEAMKL